jgi:hypothetical protein
MFEQHAARCTVRGPPGDEIYRDETLSVFELDARQDLTYAENLSHIGELFLDCKVICDDPFDCFYFYILCERKPDGYHMVGYFSLLREPIKSHNLCCILVLPSC